MGNALLDIVNGNGEGMKRAMASSVPRKTQPPPPVSLARAPSASGPTSSAGIVYKMVFSCTREEGLQRDEVSQFEIHLRINLMTKLIALRMSGGTAAEWQDEQEGGGCRA